MISPVDWETSFWHLTRSFEPMESPSISNNCSVQANLGKEMLVLHTAQANSTVLMHRGHQLQWRPRTRDTLGTTCLSLVERSSLSRGSVFK